jgi:predicted permease
MEALVNVAFPIFAIMVLGYAAGHRKLLGAESTSALNSFVFIVALPAAVFGFTARAEFSEILNWSYIGAYLLGSLGTVVLAVIAAALIFRLSRKEVIFHGGMATYGNTGYMGIPIFLTAFGPEGVLPNIVTNIIGPTALMVLMMLIFEVMQRPGVSILGQLREIVRVFIRNPVIAATVAGIAYSLSGLPIPTPVGNLLNLLTDSAGPTALFALGLSLVGQPILGDLMEVGWQTFLKLVIHPLLVWVCVTEIFTMDPFWAQSAVILAALPTGASIFVVAQQYDVAVRRASATVALSTAVSVVTISVLFVLLGVK